ncbi:MAG: copper resistance protein B [Gammaproteobacteria bacterium]|nr:copper resistance protein B [Gammaproteobacteria bacterium]
MSQQATKIGQKSLLTMVLLAAMGMQPVLAQDAMQTMPEMDHNSMPGMDHGTALSASDSTMGDMTDMSTMDPGTMQGGSAPADARDPHAYSGGYTLESGPYNLPGPRQLRLADEHNFGSLLVDRLETVRTSDNTSTAYDLQAWYGRDYDRVVLKAEGHYDDGDFEEASTELLWGHALTAYWDSQVGLRFDSGEGPDRSWLAFGVQGLAPYWFEVDATAYVGEEGRTALSVEAEYELLLTQKIILQPRIEAAFYGKDDDELGIGSGLSEAKAGLRLRYEIRREFAPYVGVEWVGMFGGTSDYARAAGLDTKETQAVAGIRFWF